MPTLIDYNQLCLTQQNIIFEKKFDSQILYIQWDKNTVGYLDGKKNKIVLFV